MRPKSPTGRGMALALPAALLALLVPSLAEAKPTLSASARTAVAAQTVQFTGVVRDGARGQRVTLEVQARQQAGWRVVRTVRLNARKAFAVRHATPLGATKYRVRSAKRGRAGVSKIVVVKGVLGTPVSPLVKGERTSVRGVLPTPRKRVVVLQRKQGGRWVQVARGRSSATGTVSLPYTATGTQTLRVAAPTIAVRRRVVAPAFTSSQVRVGVVAQSLALTMPDPMCTATKYEATVAAKPARPGRAVQLQASSDSGATWTNLGPRAQTTRQALQLAFEAPDTAATYRFRVAIPAAKGVPGATSAVTTRPVADCGGPTITYPFVAAGAAHTCMITVSRDTYCWGENTYGALGDGTTTHRYTPTLVSGGHKFKLVALGAYHSCGLTDDGTAYCWGNNGSYDYAGGALGDGTTTDRHVPTPVSGGIKFKHISSGQGTTCGVSTVNLAFCWGNNDDGQLGNNDVLDNILNNQNQLTPTLVHGGYTFKTIDVHGWRTCALTPAGVPYCWGGPLVVPKSNKPVAVPNGGVFEAIDVGNSSACGRRKDNSTFCWGYDTNGVLGVAEGTDDFSESPKPVAGGPYTSVGVGLAACALTTAGAAQCWGNNLVGTLGNGNGGNIANSKGVPVNVVGGHTWKQLSVGYAHVCGVTGAIVRCWGQNFQGQLGTGSIGTFRDTPTLVVNQ